MSNIYYIRKVVARKPKYKYRYYVKNTNREVTDKHIIEQLDAIKIPATYTEVTLNPNPKNRLQGTGYDGTGRKQYFYSKKHLDEAREGKYRNLIFLEMNLPQIMKDIMRLTSVRSTPSLDSLNAMALQIMLLCNFRVGSSHNQKKYQTYGLSTLTVEHVSFKGSTATISFNGKKQQLNECTLSDRNIVNMLKKLVEHNKKKSSKQHYLFSWDGVRVTPDSLNEFLGKYHEDITTKTWRTWFANIRYLNLMRETEKKLSPSEVPKSETQRKRLSNQVVKQVACELHHTAAICKKNYLMTELIDLYVKKPDRWKLGRNQSPDKFFVNFLKSYYSISNKWIHSRSRSRRSSKATYGQTRSRSRQRIGGAMGGPTWKPELAAHKPGYTGKLRQHSSTKKASSRKQKDESSDSSSYSYSTNDSSSGDYSDDS